MQLIMLFKKYFSIYYIIYCIIKDEKWYADEVTSPLPSPLRVEGELEDKVLDYAIDYALKKIKLYYQSTAQSIS
jgi:hypothetical protein